MTALVSPYLTPAPRPLWEVIAGKLANAKPDDPELVRWNRLYSHLSPADKLRCRAELYAIKRAKRGESHATVNA